VISVDWESVELYKNNRRRKTGKNPLKDFLKKRENGDFSFQSQNSNKVYALI